MKWLVTAALVVTILIVWRIARRGESTTRTSATNASTEVAREGAHHWRLETANGAVHVWVPGDYEPASADTVVYIHGFYSDVDEAWTEHRLAAQFAASGLNAMFIACEAPSGPRDEVVWPAVGDLLRAVAHHLDRELPRGDVIAVGHSAAYQTLATWLDEPRLRTIVRLDVPGGDAVAYQRWLGQSSGRRLIDVAPELRPWTTPLQRLPGAVSLDDSSVRACDRSVDRARVVFVKNTAGHMEMVVDGEVIPFVLRCFGQRREPPARS
ncbi:MAG: hypothetical protein AB7P03_20815 [Kofleriaceae bacterium]